MFKADNKLSDKCETNLEGSGPSFVPPLYKQRYAKVRDILVKNDISTVADFGCSEGQFLWYLKNEQTIRDVAAIDIDENILYKTSKMANPLIWDYIFRRNNPLRIRVFCGSISERDSRLKIYEAVTCIELIEHLNPEILIKLPEIVFNYLCPSVAVFTTPNVEFNVLFPNLEGFRHWDHKFEWTMEQFQKWGDEIIEKYPLYTVAYDGVGEPPADYKHLGNCSQIAVFKRIKEPLEVQDEECLSYTLVEESHHPVKEKEEPEEE